MQSDQAAFNAGCQYVQQQMARGVRDQAIFQSMVAEGWDPGMVSQIMMSVRPPQAAPQQYPQAAGGYAASQSINYYTPRAQQPARSYGGGGSGAGTHMAIGALICIVGIVITVGSYMAASSSPGGGSYVVAWGAIVFGAIRFFKGMAMLGR